jgi:outer membrane protein
MIFLMQMARAGAQDSLWTLEGSIQYALIHNIDIRQSTLNQRLAALQLKQSQLSQIPSVSASANYGRSFGRSIDPTTNQFINAGYNFSGINANADVLLFGWFQKRKTIERDKLSLKAAKADWDQLQDDIALNVATGFLRVLLAGEQMKIAQKQVELSHNQRLQTAAFVQAGTKPALELLQLSAQVATDSATYFNALAEYNQSLLEIKALMNLDIGAPFVAVAPNVENPSIAEIASGSPEQIYEVAAANFGAIKSGQIQEEAARKSLAAYRS